MLQGNWYRKRERNFITKDNVTGLRAVEIVNRECLFVARNILFLKSSNIIEIKEFRC